MHSTDRRHPAVAALILSLVGSLALLVVGNDAQAAKVPSPTRIQIDAVHSAIAPPDGTPPSAQPYVLAAAGQELTVDVSFWDGSEPAQFNKETGLTISSPQASLAVVSAVAPAASDTATLVFSVDGPANRVSLTVDDVASGRDKVAGDTSDPEQLFDVVGELRFEPATTGFVQGIGGASDCTEATEAEPVCGIVMLPQGAAGSEVALSIGVCDPDGTPADDTYAPCVSELGAVVQTLADLGGLYSRTAPATVLMKCDKTLCGGGAIRETTLNYSLSGNAPLQQVPECPAKNTIGDDQDACVDYVQSQRDGSGDTLLYFLFTSDARISVG